MIPLSTTRPWALAWALGLATAAQASPSALPDGSVVTATLANGPATGLLSLDDGYAGSANPATATVSSDFGNIEFLTDDLALAFDWTDDGVLTVWNNSGSALAANYTLQFSFPGPVGAFWDLGGTGLSASVSGDVLTLTVLASRFPAGFDAVAAARIAVPEPATWALAFTGLLAAATVRRTAPRGKGVAA